MVLVYNTKGRRTTVKPDSGIRTGTTYGKRSSMSTALSAISLLVVLVSFLVAFSYVPAFRAAVTLLLGG